MKQKFAPYVLALSLLLSGCGQPQQQSLDYIGAEQAKTAALQSAALSAEGVTFSDVVLDKRNGLDYYGVEFVSQGQTYTYAIDALTGVVIESTPPAPAETVAVSVAPSPSAPPAITGTTTPPVVPGTTVPVDATSAATQKAPEGAISAEDAKSKALTHAGLKSNQVSFVKAKLDYEDGRQVYDVEFYTDEPKEYDYEIDAMTGEVISYDYDADAYTPPAATDKSITADAAKKIALEQVPGATTEDIREFKTDYDDGRLAYEGKIIYDGQEYEFEVDGYSGAIRSWEVEPADRW